ncbi:MAG TPA: YtxH domain-containing protein [Terriglobales bacterium]|nr:YtxH domain-containing protein [Terriglobales bacterium]
MSYKRFGEYQASERSSVGTALTFLFIGLGIGALTALLFAPKTGKQMRRLLRRRYDDALEGAEDLVERGGEWVKRGSELAEEVRDRVSPVSKMFDR